MQWRACRSCPAATLSAAAGSLAAQVDLTLREGARDRFRARAGLSGTSATVLAEGPLTNGRGSWLVSARRSYLDLLLNRIEDENSLAFGFTDAEAKFVLDVSPRHQLQALAVVGTSGFEEDPDQLGVNDEATVDGRSWLTALTWRLTPSSRLVWSTPCLCDRAVLYQPQSCRRPARRQRVIRRRLAKRCGDCAASRSDSSRLEATCCTGRPTTRDGAP